MITPFLVARDPAALLENEDFLWLVGAFVGVLLVGALLLAWVERWRRRQLADSPAHEISQFGNFKAMYERGELTQQEYERIKAKEADRLRKKLLGKPVEAASFRQVPPAQPAPQEPTEPPTALE